MGTRQNQDLVLFEDHSLVSEQVLEGSLSYLALVTHVQGTSPSWLINSLVENSLVGTASLVNKDLNIKIPNRSQVIFISFLNPKSYYVNACKKNGIDLESITGFTYIDCFTDLFTTIIKDTSNASGSINKLFDELNNTISQINDRKKVIFIEAPELLLSATNISTNELLFKLVGLNKLSQQLFIISNKDYPDLDANIPDDPVFKITDFLIKLFHRSSLNISIQPLSTGRANDITGSLTISKGAIPYKTCKVNEKEYIYNITKDSNIKLFFR